MTLPGDERGGDSAAPDAGVSGASFHEMWRELLPVG